ncbi:hypothetical protein NKH18_36400 [Streptomyces sp. M10(2022)]
MLTSLLKTLAAKHRSRVTAMANRYKTTIKTPQGPRRCFEARVEREGRKPLVARFGGIPSPGNGRPSSTTFRPPCSPAQPPARQPAHRSAPTRTV